MRLLHVVLLGLRKLKRLADRLRMLQLRRLLGGCTPRLVLLEVLAGVRLRMRLRSKLLLLVRDALRGEVERRVGFGVLRALFLLLLLVVNLLLVLLLWCRVLRLSMQLGVR